MHGADEEDGGEEEEGSNVGTDHQWGAVGRMASARGWAMGPIGAVSTMGWAIGPMGGCEHYGVGYETYGVGYGAYGGL